MDSCQVVAVDVGSVRGNFAWAATTLSGDTPHSTTGGRTPIEMLSVVTAAIENDQPVAVGWEAPMMLPVPDTDSWPELGRGRLREGSRSWSAGAGTGALATGLAQAAWFCRALAQSGPQTPTTCDPQKWRQQGGLLLWEAFVSGRGKPNRITGELSAALPNQHEADAAAAVAAFIEVARGGRLSLNQSHVTTGEHRPLNLLGVAAQSAGLPINPAEINQGVLVLKTATPTGS